MFDLFGPEIPLAAKFFIAFAVVLALIGLTAWLVRRFGSNRLGGGARGRQPRLAVIDAATVDGRRRLVLIRRDNIEHLLMIGGPTDLVVEPNIVRAVARDISRDAVREPVRGNGQAEPVTRHSPVAENSWPLQPLNEPTPLPAPRPYRAAATEEPWLAPEPGARPRPPDSLTGMAAELSTRLTPPEIPVARPEPPRPSAVVPPPEPPAPPQTDHNLAEMAQQLEAALRRAPIPESRPPVTDPLAAAPARDPKPRAEPKFEFNTEPKIDSRIDAKREFKIEPKIESRIEPPVAPKVAPKVEPKTPAKAEAKSEIKSEIKPETKSATKPETKPEPAAAMTSIDSLEEEMANLLGRPSGKT
jgi:flagellar protein FliO/FliZ